MDNIKNLDEHFMKMAIEEAKNAFEYLEVPVGAVIINDKGEIIAKAHNLVESYKDATSHAELLCIQRASQQINSWRLLGCSLYSTLEPCCMCLGALFLSRIKRVIWGAPDIRHGACGSWVCLHQKKHPTHNLEFSGGILAEECAKLLRDFFELRRG